MSANKGVRLQIIIKFQLVWWCWPSVRNMDMFKSRGKKIIVAITQVFILLSIGAYMTFLFTDRITRKVMQPLPKSWDITSLSNEINSPTHRRREVNYTIRYRKAERLNNSFLHHYSDERDCQGLSRKWAKMPGVSRELIQLAPEIFEKIPLHFLRNFKNPCWLRNNTELNCLPYFYVIGASKCGTTDIWSKILSHPDVINVPKEPHWWGPRRLGYTGTPIHRKEVLTIRKITGGKDDSSLEWYLNLYKSWGVPEIIRNRAKATSGMPCYQKVFGDASVSTSCTIGLKWTELFPNSSEPVYTNAQLLHAVQPSAKIILMVRDPTLWTISYYWYSYPRGSAKGFHALVVKHIRCLRDCLQNHTIRYCAYTTGCPYRILPGIKSGLYSVFARDWIGAFSRDGVLVIRLEDLRTHPLSTYRKIIKFLDLRELSEQAENEIIHARKKNVNKKKKPILPKTKKLLDDFYTPYKKEMALLMMDDSFLYPIT